MMYQCATCGNIVPREHVDVTSGVARCPECVLCGETIKWPGIRVESEPFGRNAVPERLHQMSIGYLKSAQALCCDLGEHPEHLDWPRASVAYFCVYHAVELFLKGCILLRAPSGEKLHHSVSKLQDRYCELYPEIKDEFHIETPWDIDFETMSLALDVEVNVEKFEHNTDQVYRYMTGKSGQSPRMFLALEAAYSCVKDWKRKWCAYGVPWAGMGFESTGVSDVFMDRFLDALGADPSSSPQRLTTACASVLSHSLESNYPLYSARCTP